MSLKKKQIRHRKRNGNKERRKCDNRNAGRKRDRSFQTRKRIAPMELRHYVPRRVLLSVYNSLIVP